MKRIATLAVILMLGLTASAHSIRYFTESQAVRTVRYLGAQNEMMIYCGYDYEIETYVLINEVWMERINSAYYEIWVFGYDAYTGDEVYMPLDLGCVWLYSAGRMYNAAQYLRFHTTARMPSFTWYVPAYHPYTRIVHRPGYVRSYHYDVHRYGWMPPAYHHHGPGMPPPPLPPYYMRQPGAPAPRPSNTWTPGVDRPVVSTPSSTGRTGTAGRVITGNSNTGGSDGVRTGNNNGSSRGTSTGTSTGSSRGTSTGSSSSSRGTTTGTTPTRSNTTAASSRSTSTDRSAATSAETSKPKATTSRGTQTSSSSSRGTSTSTSTGSSRSRGTSTGTSTGSRGTNSRSNSRTR